MNKELEDWLNINYVGHPMLYNGYTWPLGKTKLISLSLFKTKQSKYYLSTAATTLKEVTTVKEVEELCKLLGLKINQTNGPIVAEWDNYFLRDDIHIRKNADIEPNQAYSLFRISPYERLHVFSDCTLNWATKETVKVINKDQEDKRRARC